MATFCNTTNEKFDDSLEDLGLNIQRRHSFLAPDEMEPAEGGNTREEEYESPTSECTSAGLLTRQMSTESTGEDESISYQTDGTASSSMTYAYQLPQMQPGTQLYQPLTCDQHLQLQQGYQIPCAQVGMPTYGYAPVQVQSMPMGLPMHHQLQPNQVLYPMQQCQPRPQEWAPMPLPTISVPSMGGPVTYSQQSNPESYQASPSVVSSAVSTPIVSYSTPGYSITNPYGYYSTPVLSSASCTPMQYAMTCAELPPLLNLNSNVQAGVIPQRISCNITGPDLSSCPSASETPASDYVAPSDPKAETEAEPEKEDNLWPGTCNYAEYQRNGGSNLFITWSGPKAKLVEQLHNFKLDVRDVLSTSDPNVCNVIFESHPIARKAFTMQNQIRLRIVPPKNSHRIWLRNPSPKFLVKFETKCKLVVRKGKAECHDIVGELLKGCLICADQLKGNRIRVVSCEGSFMFPGGKIVEMKGVPNQSGEKATLGWVSHRCKYTKEALVIRRSWNLLSDYVFNE